MFSWGSQLLCLKWNWHEERGPHYCQRNTTRLKVPPVSALGPNLERYFSTQPVHSETEGSAVPAVMKGTCMLGQTNYIRKAIEPVYISSVLQLKSINQRVLTSRSWLTTSSEAAVEVLMGLWHLKQMSRVCNPIRSVNGNYTRRKTADCLHKGRQHKVRTQ